jgi:hypothetical protein
MDNFLNDKEISLNSDYVFKGLVFGKNKENIWNQYKGWGYFNELIKKGGNKELFLEKIEEMVLELTHIYISYSVLFLYLTYTMLGVTFLSILGGNTIITFPILTLLCYLLKIFFYRKAIREYHTLYDENLKDLMGFVYRDKTLIILPFRDKLKKAIGFIFIW